MNLSLYTAAAGAKAQQTRLDVISNNLANLQTDGYKSQRADFSDLLYENYKRGAADDPETGSGSRIENTDISFELGSLQDTGGLWDFAIEGSGFFGLYNMETETVTYTRSGNFHLSNFGNNTFYLAAENGELVLSSQFGLIPVMGGVNNEEPIDIGVFDFAHKEGFLALGGKQFMPSEQSGQPFLREDAQVKRGKIEASNVDLADEMTRVIESQRAYQMALRMIQTTDEVEQTINSLR